jgi:hypothetical protein
MPFKGVFAIRKKNSCNGATTEISAIIPKGPTMGAFGKNIMKSDLMRHHGNRGNLEHHRKKSTRPTKATKAMLTMVTMETVSKPHKPYQH